MKNLILIIIACAFLVSCRAAAQIQNSNSADVIGNSVEFTQTQPETAIANDDLDSKIGTVQSGKQSVCLRIMNPNLKAGEKIQIVKAELPQKFVEAEISEKAECVNEDFGDLDDNGVTNYLLKSSDTAFLKLGYGIGVVTTQKVEMKGKFATLDLNGDRKAEYFRECTSMEGIHLTVWTGKPLVGKGIWHAYYGLGYDTVPTCKKKDFDGTDD